MVNKWHLKRLKFQLHKRLSEEFSGVPIEVLAQEIGDGVSLTFTALIFGRSEETELEIEWPASMWHAVKAIFRLPYKRKKIRATVWQLFPDLKAPNDTRTITWMESDDIPNCISSCDFDGAGQN